jgi:hypothetical protein
MKVCYFLQTHTNPEQIYRLVRVIKNSSPNALVIVSHDFEKCNLGVAELEKWSGVSVLRGKGGRGNFLIVQRLLDAIDWLFDQKIEFDWLVNLTGQDYPVQPIEQFEQSLSSTKYDGFIEYINVFSPQCKWGAREGYTRYYFRYTSLVNNLPNWLKNSLRPIKAINYIQPFFRVNFAYGITFGLKTTAPFTDNFICYGGSFYWTLSRKCINYFHEFYRKNPDFIDYYKKVCVSDESLFQTILVNSKLFNFCNDNKRYYDYSKTRNGHPRTLITEDYQSIVKSEKYFARKFDPNIDSDILDLLDTKIEMSRSSGNLCSTNTSI